MQHWVRRRSNQQTDLQVRVLVRGSGWASDSWCGDNGNKDDEECRTSNADAGECATDPDCAWRNAVFQYRTEITSVEPSNGPLHS